MGWEMSLGKSLVSLWLDPKAIIYTATTTDSDTATIPAKNTAAIATIVTKSAAVSTIRELKQGKIFSRGQQ